jgi:hypothetical protein
MQPSSQSMAWWTRLSMYRGIRARSSNRHDALDMLAGCRSYALISEDHLRKVEPYA